MSDQAPPAPHYPTAHGKRSGAARRKLRKERQALLDAQFADLEIDPQKEPRLPVELQLKILQVGPDQTSILGSSGAESREYRAFLRQASLVCSLWRTEAQKILWEAPHFTSDTDMKSFLAVEQTRGRTRCLKFASSDEEAPGDVRLDGHLVERVIRRCEGLKRLVVYGLVTLDINVLYGSSLADLTELLFGRGVMFTLPTPSTPPRPLFKLDILHIHMVYPHSFIPEIFLPLLEAVRETALVVVDQLRSASLGGVWPPASFQPSQPLRMLALSLQFASPSFDLAQPFLLLLQQCHSLHIIVTNHVHHALFAGLPSVLDDLAL